MGADVQCVNGVSVTCKGKSGLRDGAETPFLGSCGTEWIVCGRAGMNLAADVLACCNGT